MSKYKKEKLREKIEKIRKIVERIDKYELPLKISKVKLFGSLLWKKEKPGDVDIVLKEKGVSKIGNEWLKKIEDNRKYLLELTKGYKKMKKFVEENKDNLRRRGLKPEWFKHITLEEVRPSYKCPPGLCIYLNILTEKILKEGLGKRIDIKWGSHLKDKIPTVTLYENGIKHLEYLNFNEKNSKKLQEIIGYLREKLREITEGLRRVSCAIEILGKILKDDRNVSKEIKVNSCIHKSTTEKIKLAAPFLIYYFRKEIEKILSNKLRFKGGLICSYLSKNKENILKEWIIKSEKKISIPFCY